MGIIRAKYLFAHLYGYAKEFTPAKTTNASRISHFKAALGRFLLPEGKHPGHLRKKAHAKAHEVGFPGLGKK